MNLLIKLIPFLIFAYSIYRVYRSFAGPTLKSSGFNRSRHLKHDIYIEKTHRGEYNLNDKDGFGLVYGKVVQLSFDNTPQKNLYVKYLHAKSNDESFAFIDAETLEVKSIKAEDVPVSLADIQTYY